MQYHKDHYNLDNTEEPMMHTIVSPDEFMEDKSTSKKKKGKKGAKQSDANFKDFYH